MSPTVDLRSASDHKDVVALAREGREAAYRELIRRYERPVFALIYRMVRDRETAEEMVYPGYSDPVLGQNPSAAASGFTTPSLQDLQRVTYNMSPQQLAQQLHQATLGLQGPATANQSLGATLAPKQEPQVSHSNLTQSVEQLSLGNQIPAVKAEPTLNWSGLSNLFNLSSPNVSAIEPQGSQGNMAQAPGPSGISTSTPAKPSVSRAQLERVHQMLTRSQAHQFMPELYSMQFPSYSGSSGSQSNDKRSSSRDRHNNSQSRGYSKDRNNSSRSNSKDKNYYKSHSKDRSHDSKSHSSRSKERSNSKSSHRSTSRHCRAAAETPARRTSADAASVLSEH